MPRDPILPSAVLCSTLLAVMSCPAAAAGFSGLQAACSDENFQTVLRPLSSKAVLAARAVWLNRQWLRWPGVSTQGRFKLYYSSNGKIALAVDGKVHGADGNLALDVAADPLPDAITARFKYVADGAVLAVQKNDWPRLSKLHRQQTVLVREDAQGRVRDATSLQIAGVLDDLYAEAAQEAQLGVRVASGYSEFKLWAPTAQQVSLCLYRNDNDKAESVQPMRREDATGIWTFRHPTDLSGHYYTYLVEVFVPGRGMVRNRVADPYAISLGSDSRRAYIADLNASSLKPAGWDDTPRPERLSAATDSVIYELHVRDFSINDISVAADKRGKYLAFTGPGSNGMRHLRALAEAGLTDVHLMPVFDFATVPETGCVTPNPKGEAASESQQATVGAARNSDCFNWGYDPLHFNAPEGSYASDAADGARRIIEFRQMVQALHRARLRVGMDMVYNHTSASGQQEKSVLDRIVPGYYHRLDAQGEVEMSTCCANTATENRMMAKLMIDSAAIWARDYRIDSFRFDLMGHQPRAAMEQLKAHVNTAVGRDIQLIGEGWNFGEVADGARFVQASQLSLNGSGIGTFSDRARDALRGGSASDNGVAQIKHQGYLNGLFYDPNALAAGASTKADVLRAADLVRVGLAGSIRNYPMINADGETVPLARIDYNGQPAGYVSEPGEVVNYVENHDNQTLFDNNVFKLPVGATREERARVQVLGLAVTAFSQGIAYFHAGVDTLRSKSMDRNSFDSGDWFNRLDWTYGDNFFGSGLPPQPDNGKSWPLLEPLLANPAIKPNAADIAWTRDAFRDLLRIRASSGLFRLHSAADIQRRLTFYNTGPAQEPTVLVGYLDGTGHEGAGFRELLYLVNVDKIAHSVTIPALKGKSFVLHPAHLDPAAADRRPRNGARYQPEQGAFTVPPRTALVYVVN